MKKITIFAFILINFLSFGQHRLAAVTSYNLTNNYGDSVVCYNTPSIQSNKFALKLHHFYTYQSDFGMSPEVGTYINDLSYGAFEPIANAWSNYALQYPDQVQRSNASSLFNGGQLTEQNVVEINQTINNLSLQYAYDGQNRLIKRVILKAGNLDTVQVRTRTYTSIGEVLTDKVRWFNSGVNYSHEIDSIVYLSGNISRIYTYGTYSGSVIDRFNEFTYNTGKLSKITYFNNELGNYIEKETRTFSYSASNLTGIIHRFVSNGAPQTPHTTESFSYNAGQLSQHVTNRFTDVETRNISYFDNNFIREINLNYSNSGQSTNYRMSYYYDGEASIAETEQSIELSVYPNPTTDVLNISSKVEIKQIDIFDLSGKLLISQTGPTLVNVASLLDGNYLVQVKTVNGHSASSQFLKNN